MYRIAQVRPEGTNKENKKLCYLVYGFLNNPSFLLSQTYEIAEKCHIPHENQKTRVSLIDIKMPPVM